MFERGSVLVLVVGIHEQLRVAGQVFVCCWKKKEILYYFARLVAGVGVGAALWFSRRVEGWLHFIP
jgi:hypothetical protein